MLNDQVNATTLTDTAVSDGDSYRYYAEAVNAAGISGASQTVDAQPMPQPPAAAPATLTAEWTKTRQGPGITLKWAPVPGATGYVIYRSYQEDQFKWPDNFVIPLLETTWTDTNRSSKKNERYPDKHIDPAREYYYQVTAINAGGVSQPATVHLASQSQ
jgi:fibronectin type 3 domain-containing protein